MVAVSKAGRLCASAVAPEFGCEWWARWEGVVRMLSQVGCAKEDVDVFSFDCLSLSC